MEEKGGIALGWAIPLNQKIVFYEDRLAAATFAEALASNLFWLLRLEFG